MDLNSISFNWNDISKYRQSLMGLSIIMVLLCHARMDGANLPNILLSILSLGNWGVDIFLLLSGIGMYYSISKQRDNINWRVWIFKRLKRILIPYLIIESPFRIWYAIHNGLGVEGFLYYISFASYWVEHIGLWFVALLIPLYILTPVFYKLFDNRLRYLYLSLFVVLVLVGSAVPFDSDSETIRTVQGCLWRIPCYLIGFCFGYDVKNYKKSIGIIIVPILLYILMQSLPFFLYKGWIWGILITICLTKILGISLSKFTIKPLSYVGRYTLELYIGSDISKNILVQFMEPSTVFCVLTIVGSVLIAILYNSVVNRYLNPIL